MFHYCSILELWIQYFNEQSRYSVALVMPAFLENPMAVLTRILRHIQTFDYRYHLDSRHFLSLSTYNLLILVLNLRIRPSSYEHQLMSNEWNELFLHHLSRISMSDQLNRSKSISMIMQLVWHLLKFPLETEVKIPRFCGGSRKFKTMFYDNWERNPNLSQTGTGMGESLNHQKPSKYERLINFEQLVWLPQYQSLLRCTVYDVQ